MGESFGFSNIWTGELISNEIKFNIDKMSRSELDEAISMLSSNDNKQVLKAIEIITANCDKKAVKELMSMLFSRKGPLREVTNALIGIQDKSIMPDLLEFYKVSSKYGSDGRGEYQRSILQIINGLESDKKKINELFIEIVNSDNPIEARRYAAYELGMRGGPEVIKALFIAANSKPEQVQLAAIDALGIIGSRLKNNEKHIIIEPMAKIMRTSPDRNIRSRAVDALSRTGSDLVVSYLVEALKDENLFVGAKASTYLGRLGGMEHIGPIEEYLGRAQKDGQKNAARSAIKFIRQRNSSKQ
jgi:HEAT repeat protein